MFVIPTGSARVDTLTVRGPMLFNAANEPRGATEGRVKLLLFATECPDGGSCGSSGPIFESNEFVVRVVR